MGCFGVVGSLDLYYALRYPKDDLYTKKRLMTLRYIGYGLAVLTVIGLVLYIVFPVKW